MSIVGIIANPLSGKDIRRLVSKSRLIPNQEKINIITRILSGLESTGVKDVLFMPDRSNISKTAAENHNGNINSHFLEMSIFDNQIDTTTAVSKMIEQDVKAIIVLGGDGTSRAAVKAIDSTPIMPISTGTNNVFPYLIEGTLAGIAVGCVAIDYPSSINFAPQHKILEVDLNSTKKDIALVDIAISHQTFVGARAIWDINSVSELFLTFANPASIGLSSIGGMVHPILRTESKGMRIELESKNPNLFVKAPITPGEIFNVGISTHELMIPDKKYRVPPKSCTIALDGERTIPVNELDQIEISLRLNGPNVINPFKTLQEYSKSGHFSDQLSL